MKRRTVAILIVLLGMATMVILAVFAPAVSLAADIPGSGGFSTTTTTQGNMTRTITVRKLLVKSSNFLRLLVT